MIKIYCNKCGKEIANNMNTTEEYHLCNTCKINNLTCGFKVGDQVITDDGRIGTIINICTCEKCKERGFYEPEVAYDNGEINYIMVSAKNNGFKSYYKIGDHIFGNLNEGYLVSRISTLREEMQELELQLDVVKVLKENQSNLSDKG